jgi:nucleoside-diphosphate-sugar epimerase
MLETVLVTGGTGFIAQHCMIQLLDAGYDVRTTVRSVARTTGLTALLAPHVGESVRSQIDRRLVVVQADLTSDAGWDEAVAGCRFVLHVASPLPLAMPRNESDLVVPARDGSLRVLDASHRAGVQRVVLTSSIAAIGYGRDRDHMFTEEDWSNVDGPNIDAYAKSKTLAERAAWEFMRSLGSSSRMDLVVINPGLVLGPLLSGEWSSSGEAIKKILDRKVPGIPDLVFPVIDVRDVAATHLAAMTTPSAAGQRYICALDAVPLREIALILARHYGPLGYRIPTRRLPKFLLRIAALFDHDLRLVVSEIGQPFLIDSSKIRRAFDLSPRDVKEMTLSMADSMIRYGVVRDRTRADR